MTKLYFVVNSSLGMSKGKIAAQVAHAAYRLGRTCLPYNETAIVLAGRDERHLRDIMAALPNKVARFLYREGVSNEVPPGSYTVLAFIGDGDVVQDLELL